MTYKHSFVDDYPYLAYSSSPETAQAQTSDVAALDTRLDAIEAADWVTTSRIKDGAVTADKLASNSVATAKVADGAVTTAKIADDAITTAKIADDAVTADKIAE